MAMYEVPSVAPMRIAPSLPTSILEISVKCEKLLDRDVFSKSDPFCVLLIKKQGRWYELDRTETLMEKLNPEWQKKFVVNYNFEEKQEIKFEVYDTDTTSSRLSEHDFLGRYETTLGTLVSSGNKMSRPLHDTPRSNMGKIHIFAEELKFNKQVAKIQLSATKLDKKDFLGKSDPYFVMSKQILDGQYAIVYRSEVIQNTLDPNWIIFKKPVAEICNGDYERSLKFEVYDWDSNGKDDFIGSFTTTLKELSTAEVEKKTFPCINEAKKKKKSSYKNSGIVSVKSIKIEEYPTFVEYIQGGTAMNFSVAVDFTASNGDPRDPQSLHYMDFNGETQYTNAIRAVGEVIQDYDTDKQYPALGFGARIPPTGKVSHEFFLNLTDSPFCSGVEGLLAAYHKAVQTVTLFGPTNFSPVIEHVAKFAQAYQDGKQYFVLLIITDGIITDLDRTKSSIIRASHLPMSIIIIGVGNEEFATMRELDSDQAMLTNGTQTAVRDIVQFVKLRKFMGAGYSWDKELLAKEVLHEIPQQVVGWMMRRRIQPFPKPTAPPVQTN